MKTYQFSLALFVVLFLFEACSDDDVPGPAGPDLSAVVFSADSHVRTASLPQNILDYITENYSGLTIHDAEIEDNNNYEIELSNGLELIFNAQGDFLGIDDDDENDFDDEKIDPADLPQNILDFINQNYPDVGIDEAELENNGNYEIELENDIEIIFDNEGNFLGQARDENDDDQGEDEVDIDPSQLPQVILDYISENYPGNTIIAAEIDEDGAFEVTLNNGIEIEFDSEGNFLYEEDGNGDDDDEEEDDD